MNLHFNGANMSKNGSSLLKNIERSMRRKA